MHNGTKIKIASGLEDAPMKAKIPAIIKFLQELIPAKALIKKNKRMQTAARYVC